MLIVAPAILGNPVYLYLFINFYYTLIYEVYMHTEEVYMYT